MSSAAVIHKWNIFKYLFNVLFITSQSNSQMLKIMVREFERYLIWCLNQLQFNENADNDSILYCNLDDVRGFMSKCLWMILPLPFTYVFMFLIVMEVAMAAYDIQCKVNELEFTKSSKALGVSLRCCFWNLCATTMVSFKIPLCASKIMLLYSPFVLISNKLLYQAITVFFI